MTATRSLVIRNRSGLHARPAARLAEQAKSFDSALTVEKDGQTANAKSLISLIKLGVSAGAAVTLTAEGPDEEAALDALVALLDQLEAEDAREETE